jgi:two-component system heavy metal sensor histidine kinase CusS
MIAGAAFEHALNDRLLRHDKEELVGKIALVRDIISSAHNLQDIRNLSIRLNDVAFGHPGMVISVRAATGVLLFSAGDQQVAKQLIEGNVAFDAKPALKAIDERYYRFISSQAVLGAPEGGPVETMIALDITDDHNFVTEAQEIIWFGVAQIALVLGGLGWVVVRHGLAPLRKLSAMMSGISTRQLDKPLEDREVPTELLELVAAFNAMLARLHDSFRRLADFSSDIAHELRTPIHNLLIQTQVTLGGQDSLDAYRSVLQSNEEEYQRLSAMISDMLFLAKVDNKQVLLRKANVNLQAEVASLFEFYEALASEQGIELVQSGQAAISGDRSMIQRALSNLLSNAIRFTARGMAIKVNITAEDHWASLAICNPGPDIPVEHRERIFERLYRIDPSRREGHSDNVGLGLAITRSIIEMHGGQIGVSSQHGEVIFSIRLPVDEPMSEVAPVLRTP